MQISYSLSDLPHEKFYRCNHKIGKIYLSRIFRLRESTESLKASNFEGRDNILLLG